MDDATKERILEHISDARIKEALALLKETEYNVDSIRLLSRYEQIHQQKKRGLISFNEFTLILNNITNDILDTIGEASFKEEPKLPPKSGKRKIIALVTISISLIILTISTLKGLYSPREKLDVNTNIYQKEKLEEITQIIAGILSDRDTSIVSIDKKLEKYDSIYLLVDTQHIDPTLKGSLYDFKFAINMYEQKFMTLFTLRNLGKEVNSQIFSKLKESN